MGSQSLLIPFSRGSSPTRDWTRVSHSAGRFFTVWATREAPNNSVMCVLCLVTQLCPTLWPHGLQPARLLCPWGFSRQEYWSGLPSPPPRYLPNPGLPHCRRILYQLSHQGSPRILEWVALSLLQVFFLTQESNWDLLHCRWILHQLSYQGSPPNSSTKGKCNVWNFSVGTSLMMK